MVRLNDTEIRTEVRKHDDGSLLVTYSDTSYTCHMEEEVERYKVYIGRTLTIFEKENDPSVLRSRNAGRLSQYLAKDGQKVEVGEVYAEMESMKMVINLEVKKAGGTLIHVARPGQALFPGTLIARLEDQGDMSNSKPQPFEAKFDQWKEAEDKKKQTFQTMRPNDKFEQLLQACRDILNGYAVPESLFKERKNELVNELFAVLDDQRLPYSLFKGKLSVVETRINSIGTYKTITHLISKETEEFPAEELDLVMNNYLSTISPEEVGTKRQDLEALLNICEKFRGGLRGHKLQVIQELLNAYWETEEKFQVGSYDLGVEKVKETTKDAPEVVRKVYSHTRTKAKNELLQTIIQRLAQQDDSNASIAYIEKTLSKVANLFSKESEPLALFIRQTVNKLHHPDYKQICTDFVGKSYKDPLKTLSDLVTETSTDNGTDLLKKVLTNVSENHLVLHEFFFTGNKKTNDYAIRTFICNSFHVNNEDIESLDIDEAAAVFKFEVTDKSPLYEHHAGRNQRAFYFLSTSPDLDRLKSEKFLNKLKVKILLYCYCN